MNHRDAAQAAAKAPEKLAAVNETRIFRAELNRRLLRGTNVLGEFYHQSININSDVLNTSRQRLAMPFFCAKGNSFLISVRVGRRFSVN